MSSAADGWAWAACGASVVGSEHQRRGLGCDDAYSYGISGDFLVAAVADGAGSVSGTSAWGAYIACRSVLKQAMNPTFIDRYRAGSATDAQQLIRSLFDHALDRVQQQAAVMGLDGALLSTTLCVGLADRKLATFAQIGDGIIAIERKMVVQTLLIEHKDEYANTTTFLQSEHALNDALRSATQSGVTALALSTDGMSYKITEVATGAPYQPFFRGSWQHLRSGADSEQFEAMLSGIEDDQTGDDKTMVLAAVRETAGQAPPETMQWAHSKPPGTVGDAAGIIAIGGAHPAAEPESPTVAASARTWWARRRT